MFTAKSWTAYITPQGRILDHGSVVIGQMVSGHRMPCCRVVEFIPDYQISHSACIVSPLYEPSWQEYWYGKVQ